MIGTLDPIKREGIIENSPMYYKNTNPVVEESAYEIIQAKYERILAQQNQEKEVEKVRKAREKEIAKEKREKAMKKNPLYKIKRSTVSTLTGDIGRKIARGLLGNIGNFF